jgi:hypothetical protein
MMQAMSSRAKAAPAAQAATSGVSDATRVAHSWKVTAPDCAVRIGVMPMTCSQLLERRAAGSRGVASFWFDTITARAPLSSRICS